MEEENKGGVEPAKKQRKSPRSRKAGKARRYPFEMRLRLVKGFLEEKYPAEILCAESGVSGVTLYTWGLLNIHFSQ